MRRSYWLSGPGTAYGPLARNLWVDVAVVGAGITGATAAYLLKKGGYTVALLDRRRAGAAETGHTTAHLTAVLDHRWRDLEARLGGNDTVAVWEAGCAAIDQIERVVHEHEIDCDFARVPGYLHPRPDHPRAAEDTEALKQEAAVCQRLGIDSSWCDRIPLFDVPGLGFRRQARLHPLKYLRALLTQIDGQGSVVHEVTEVHEVSGPPMLVKAGGYRIHADRVVIATHAAIQGASGIVMTKLAQPRLTQYITYAAAGRVPKGRLPDALYWDTVNPYRYLRIAPEMSHDYVIAGGADHEVGEAPDTALRYREVEDALRSIRPAVDVKYRWSGPVTESPDGLPFIGETAEGQFSTAAFGGNGMTFGTLAGMMAADWTEGRGSRWAEIFSWGTRVVVAR